MKTCTRCQAKIGRNNRSGLCGKCNKRRRDLENRERNREYHRQWVASNPDARKGYTLKRYGLTVEEFDALLESQDNMCAICGLKSDDHGNGKRLCVDHCHETSEVRGILCSNCNTAIGLLGDDPERIAKALEYLKRHI